MTGVERMTVDERYKYLRQMQRRYRKTKRKGRSALLDEMEAVTGLHRKSPVRLMKGKIEGPRCEWGICAYLTVSGCAYGVE